MKGTDKFLLLMNMSEKKKCLFFRDNIIKYQEYNNINKMNVSYDMKYIHNSFPHSSYYRLSPEYVKRGDMLFYSYEVQHYIYTYQNPIKCDNKRYLLITGYPAGQGIELRVIASLLGLAIQSNRIAIYHPYYKSIHTGGYYCKNKSRTWSCFLEPLSNCSLNKSFILSSVEFSYFNQTERVVFVSSHNIKKYLTLVPTFVSLYINHSKIKSISEYQFWSIQSLTYVIRLNKITYKYIIDHFKEIKRIKYKKCMSVWIRHGDKIKEMKLVPTYYYNYAIAFFKSIINENFTVYLSSDDPNVFSEVRKVYLIEYLHFNRSDYKKDKKYKIRGSSLTIYVLADIMAALSCYSFCGTIKSNIIRIIHELRMTIGFQYNTPYFEME